MRCFPFKGAFQHARKVTVGKGGCQGLQDPTLLRTFRNLSSAFSMTRNPDLFLQQYLVKTLGTAIASVDYKMYLPTSADGKPIELRLNLNREPIKQGSNETKR